MTIGKPLVPRQVAQQDIEQAIAYYMAEGGADLAVRFIDTLETTFRHLGTHPATGSSRYATELDLPGLRAWPLRQFPQIIFYVEQKSHLDVWRVLHGQRDIPAWLQTDQT